jgi:hypothetical protein
MASNQNRWINYLTGQYSQQTVASYNISKYQTNSNSQAMSCSQQDHSNKRKFATLGNDNCDTKVHNKKKYFGIG